MGEISIHALEPEDWELYRNIRIRAVEMHTGYYMADPQETRNKPKEFWLENLNGQGKAIFGLFDDQAIVGLCGVFTWREDPSGETGIMAMGFIEPDYRGRGLSNLMYKARIDFAKNYLPWKKLAIGHRAGNEPSRRAMIKHGFEFVDTKEIHWPDGTHDLEYNYVMDLEKLRSQN